MIEEKAEVPNLDRLLAYLIAKREFYGADTPIGHHCSNVVELLLNRREATGDQLTHIDASLRRQLEAIERLCAAEVAAAGSDGSEAFQ